MKTIKGALVAVAVLFLASCATSQPIYNVAYKNTVSQNISKEQVKQAIIGAATFKRWRVKASSEDKLVLAINVRSHYAEVEVAYSDSGYGIDYQASENLDYEASEIHRNYNKWIKLLEIQIDQEIAAIR